MRITSKLAKGAAAFALAGAALLGTAGTASANPSAPNIGYGRVTSGPAVWCVQHDLNWYIKNAGYPSDPPYGTIPEDGVWGPKTEATVRWYQRRWNSIDDGVVGPWTGHLLLAYTDDYYNGTYSGGPGYCWKYLPGDY
ncbi:peptidoglycan-binding protein [Streptomyces sp. NPDC050504]|uniref:peptidoglycan-binding protein n=1 Tax=Streptomyces sp. NPDC050504 TaxID=3365618 RepID=UPI00379CF2BE